MFEDVLEKFCIKNLKTTKDCDKMLEQLKNYYDCLYTELCIDHKERGIIGTDVFDYGKTELLKFYKNKEKLILKKKQ